MTEATEIAAPAARPAHPARPRVPIAPWLASALLLLSAIFFALHFVHLNADFPNHSPWVDWSKYTDEGWYGDAAIRHYNSGHWYFAGDFNPAVALPVWPALELVFFRFTGVSAAAARVLTLLVFAATLAAFYLLLQRHTRPHSDHSSPPLAAALTVFFLCCSPYIYVFERMAILEPLLIALTTLAVLSASYLNSPSSRPEPPQFAAAQTPSSRPEPPQFAAAQTPSSRPVAPQFAAGQTPSSRPEPQQLAAGQTPSSRPEPQQLAAGQTPSSRPEPRQTPSSRPERSEVERPLYFVSLRNALPTLALTVLLPAMVLTKTTAICLFPAIFYMLWSRAGYRLRPALRLAVPPAIGGIALWCAYFFGFVRPHYLEDYRYLFSANAYTGIELEPLSRVVLNTLTDGAWMGHILYPAFFAVLALALFWRPRLFTNPLVPSLLLWIGGYFAFLAYHNNLQPRYYMVVAVPITAMVALGLDNFRLPTTVGAPHLASEMWVRRMTVVRTAIAALVVAAIAIPDAIQQLNYTLHPTYQFRAAADGIRRIVLADSTHPHLILSISGSDLTLMTGLPSIDDDFGTLDLDKRIKQYRPGWYVAWNEVEDDKADALTQFDRIVRVAAFPAYDDPDRNLLILYRLDPATPTLPTTPKKRHTPKPLVSRLGQQPSTNQLEH